MADDQYRWNYVDKDFPRIRLCSHYNRHLCQVNREELEICNLAFFIEYPSVRYIQSVEERMMQNYAEYCKMMQNSNLISREKMRSFEQVRSSVDE